MFEAIGLLLTKSKLNKYFINRNKKLTIQNDNQLITDPLFWSWIFGN